VWGTTYSWERGFGIDLSLKGKYIYLAGGTDVWGNGVQYSHYNAVMLKMKHDGEFQWGYYEGNLVRHDEYTSMVAAYDDSFSIGCGWRCVDAGCADRRVFATRYDTDGTRTHGYEYG
jgi:hypothetical protein